ncbi:hypothetical protein ABFS82_04G115000 [Erythranthe guttata]|uniref:Uncharacterized protein n=1 Tax=Erythranthe guttata TaxID=4155 RepID=A0A022QBD4_ERYGU|nr:PREDICTED: uncharacterized protein LOC105972319 [Erythranthe guttata]EYU24548.1 hypothetical protein MIMGU_mgv1a022058mg [Erythranthe guttata]|eukprot:XP_012852715.1 PREDICTED: uncharacterized protein LOC105972319 [Erythranthe guttata]
MVLLCFVLDLRSLSPPILRDLKQSLLQLANYYAVSCPKIDNSSRGIQSQSKTLLDRIGLCYVLRNRISCSDELKIAYSPQVNFNLRDFHHAVNSLPTDAFFSESNDSGALCKDLKLTDVLSEKNVYSWGNRDRNIGKKVILISSYLVGTLDSATMKALMDASDKCVSVEFILLEQASSQLGDITDDISHFVEQIGFCKNCSFQTRVPDKHVLQCLTKRWFEDLKDDRKEPLQARFIFKTSLISNLNQITCNLCTSFNPIVDEFISCQTCRCHGIPLDQSNTSQTKRSSCPVTNDDLGAIDIIENSVRVGEQTMLHMPSFKDSPELKQVSLPVDFNVIKRTNLGSLSEGVIMGTTYFVTASTFLDPDRNKSSETELNSQLFQVVCTVLNSHDQGLVCSSTCNIETQRETSFQCYYILLPSDKGTMLLRRLSASEEFLPIFDASQHISSVVAEEIENTVQASLLKMEVSDYNPFQHERGFHKKLNVLVKQSLQFGAILPKTKEVIPESEVYLQNSEVQPSMQEAEDIVIKVDELPQLDSKQGEKNKTSPCLAEEWEQLIVNELGGVNSPTCIYNSNLDKLVTSPSQSNKQMDEKTSRILERLELPWKLKRKAVSPAISSSAVSGDVRGPVKKPLIAYRPNDTAADQRLILSQPIKPNFQRIKRPR